MLYISEEEAMLLLHAYEWSNEKLQSAWWDRGEDAVRSSAGVSSADAAAAPEAAAETEFLCQVLYDTVPWSETAALPCGHRFSKEAWRGHFESTAGDALKCADSRCMDSSCKERVRPSLVNALMAEGSATTAPASSSSSAAAAAVTAAPGASSSSSATSGVPAAFADAFLRSFVDKSRLYKWCPAPGCKRIVVYSDGGMHDVSCDCDLATEVFERHPILKPILGPTLTPGCGTLMAESSSVGAKGTQLLLHVLPPSLPAGTVLGKKPGAVDAAAAANAAAAQAAAEKAIAARAAAEALSAARATRTEAIKADAKAALPVALFLAPDGAGHVFCFKCGSIGSHRPATCAEAKLGAGENKDDIATMDWCVRRGRCVCFCGCVIA